MATYSTFLRQHTGERARVRRLYWVYGEEEIFRLRVVNQIREMSGATPFNTLSLSAADTPESEIWAYLNQHPLDSDQTRLIVVYEAQRLRQLDRLLAWVKDNQTTRTRNAVAVFVSSEPEFEHEVAAELGKSSSAALVKCSLPKAEEDRLKRAVEIVTAWGNIDRITAGVLVKRVNYDMREAQAVMEKARLFPGSKVSVAAVEALAPRRVEEDVVWSLLRLNKRKAVEAVVEGDEISVSAILGSLATHVEVLSRMHALMATTTGIKEIASRIEVREQYVRALYPCARLYPRKEAVRRTILLTRMDAAWQRGAREGLLAALIALW